MTGRPLLTKLRGGVHRRVHIASDRCLGRRQRRDQLTEVKFLRVRHDQQVEVALDAGCAGGERSEDEGELHLRPQRHQRLPQHVGDTRGLHEQLLQLWKDRAPPVRLEVHLPAALLAAEDAETRQRRELPLDRTEAGARETRDLPQVEPLVRPQQQQRQHRGTGPAEQTGTAWANEIARTHFGYDCNHFGYGVEIVPMPPAAPPAVVSSSPASRGSGRSPRTSPCGARR